jgi:hypothetical protein
MIVASSVMGVFSFVISSSVASVVRPCSSGPAMCDVHAMMIV